MHRGFCVCLSFHFLGIHALENHSWVISQLTVSFFFLRNCKTVFQSGCPILHSHQEYKNDWDAPYPRVYLVLSLLIILAFVLSVQYYLIVGCVRECGRLRAYVTMCVPASVKCLLIAFAYFLIRLLVEFGRFFIHSGS